MLCSMRGWIWDAKLQRLLFGLCHARRWDVFVICPRERGALMLATKKMLSLAVLCNRVAEFSMLLFFLTSVSLPLLGPRRSNGENAYRQITKCIGRSASSFLYEKKNNIYEFAIPLTLRCEILRTKHGASSAVALVLERSSWISPCGVTFHLVVSLCTHGTGGRCIRFRTARRE